MKESHLSSPKQRRVAGPFRASAVLEIRSSLSVLLAGLALLAALIALQWWAVSTHRIPWRSDEAIVALMAKHILAGEGHPVFYWGAAYAGSLEPHFVALVFAVFGSSVTSYRVAMGILFVLLALGVCALTRRLSGDRAALIALVYFALPPFFLLFKGLTSDGAYISVALQGLATLSLAVAIDGSTPARRPLLYGLLGIVIGVGWWVMPITLTVSGVAILWLLTRARRPSLGGTVLLAAGTLAGSFPWWFWNLRHGWESLRVPEMGLVTFGQAATNFLGLCRTSVPILEGALQPLPGPPWLRPVFPGAVGVCALALAALLAPAFLRALRGDSRSRLLIAAGVAAILPPIFSKRFIAIDPRLGIAVYAALPVLLAEVVARRDGPGWSRWVRAGAALGLVVLHAASLARARVDFHNDDRDVTGSLDELIRVLEAERVRDVFSNYWTAYRLSFDSGERIIATPIRGNDTVRYEPYRAKVENAPRPAVVLLPPRDECYASFLRERHIRFRRLTADGFGVYVDVGAGGLETLRHGFALPLPREAHRAIWRLGPQPSTMTIGSSTLVTAEVTNAGPCPWSTFVHLGYRWRPRPPGKELIEGSARGTTARPLGPGDSGLFSVDLVAPDTSGAYQVEYDLVHEMVEWFSAAGGQTVGVPVEIVASPAPISKSR